MGDRLVRSIVRAFRVAGAFFRLGFQQSLAYPLGFVTTHLSALMPAFIFFFVAKLVDGPGGTPGMTGSGDYYTFVVIGLVAAKFLDAGIRGFSTEIEVAINRGWLEMFLVEPVRWRLLPISMIQWHAAQGIFSSILIAGVAWLLGAQYRPTGLPIALLILLLGLAAGLAIGTLSASLKVLAKSGDPILFLYGLAVQIFSGVYFSIEILPAPLRFISWLIPHTYVIMAMRRALMPGGQELGGLTGQQAVLVLAGFCLVAFPIALWLYGRALEYGRKLGVLSGY